MRNLRRDVVFQQVYLENYCTDCRGIWYAYSSYKGRKSNRRDFFDMASLPRYWIFKTLWNFGNIYLFIYTHGSDVESTAVKQDLRRSISSLLESAHHKSSKWMKSQVDYLSQCELGKSLHISKTIDANAAKFGMLIPFKNGANCFQGKFEIRLCYRDI